MTLVCPTSEDEVAEIIRHAVAKKQRIVIRGGATRTGLHTSDADAVQLSTRALTGITLYEPSEMVISARAGTPLSEVEALLATKGQHLTFEPMDHRALYGSTGEPTIGAVAACNISGPRRIQAGAARDSLIGLRFVNGQGEVIRAGGRVMKNVTGLDLVKLQAGAFGSLGVLTEVTFKVLPKPLSATTLVLSGLSDDRAIEAMAVALGTPFEISGAAHMAGGQQGVSITLLRIESAESGANYRVEELAKVLADFDPAREMYHANQDELWRVIRDARLLWHDGSAVVWRISVKPSDAPRLVDAICQKSEAVVVYDWGGGLIWLSTPDDDATAMLVRRVAKQLHAHARLEHAPEALRARHSLLMPLSSALHQLEKGIRQAVDPHNVFAAPHAPMDLESQPV
jgi:glycolate oxidase FAD binding subunit